MNISDYIETEEGAYLLAAVLFAITAILNFRQADVVVSILSGLSAVAFTLAAYMKREEE